MVSTEAAAIADLFDRIPALAALRGVPRIEAEEAIRNAVADAIAEARHCWSHLLSGGAP